MMYNVFKLKHFFLCVLILLIGLISFIVYAWRKNATAHISEDGVDISAPFYATPNTDNYHSNTNSGHGKSEKPQTEEEDQGSEHVVTPDGTTAPVHGGNEGGEKNHEGQH